MLRQTAPPTQQTTTPTTTTTTTYTALGPGGFAAGKKNIANKRETFAFSPFQAAAVRYLEALLGCQVQMAQHWEEFLPEVKAILF